MNPATILTLIADLYSQAAALRTENEQLRSALAQVSPADPQSEQH